MNISVSLTIEQWQVIGAALVGRPYAEVAQLIAEIDQQINEQKTQSEKKDKDEQ